eukprot:TRINITY_DN441_c0_g1_i1.p1 TRINITY_DN441_c0_g1~~TRINITY_DN441_c0_g1_i1.p1  ORF type:complete len:245 (-),score=27.64 TRINITY_DN441_c0_g1_i1:368-1102(-)
MKGFISATSTVYALLCCVALVPVLSSANTLPAPALRIHYDKMNGRGTGAEMGGKFSVRIDYDTDQYDASTYPAVPQISSGTVVISGSNIAATLPAGTSLPFHWDLDTSRYAEGTHNVTTTIAWTLGGTNTQAIESTVSVRQVVFVSYHPYTPLIVVFVFLAVFALFVLGVLIYQFQDLWSRNPEDNYDYKMEQWYEYQAQEEEKRRKRKAGKESTKEEERDEEYDDDDSPSVSDSSTDLAGTRV